MTEGNDALEKNLERLIRESAPPPPDVVRARREFLARVEGTPHVRLGRMIAMAASLLAAAVILYSAFAPHAPAPPPRRPPTRPLRLPNLRPSSRRAPTPRPAPRRSP